MERINSFMGVILSFSLLPFGVNHKTDFKERISQYQNTNQNTDKNNLINDWNHVGQDIGKALEAAKNEQ